MLYFNNCTTLDEAKNLFKALCFKLHPDTSGYNSQSDFVKMFAEFKAVSNTLKFKTGFEADKDFDGSKFYDIVKKFDGLNDIKISFVGSFIWLEDVIKGAMYAQKETIKSIKIDGYNTAFFARKKLSWYFKPLDYKQKYSKGKTLEQIKTTYGSTEFKTKQTFRIN